MQKSTNELEPGDLIILPASGVLTPAATVKVRAVHKYIPGIMESYARSAGHDRIVFFERELKNGQGFSLNGDITVAATANWVLA